jgi:hypothetical protein
MIAATELLSLLPLSSLLCRLPGFIAYETVVQQIMDPDYYWWGPPFRPGL